MENQGKLISQIKWKISIEKTRIKERQFILDNKDELLSPQKTPPINPEYLEELENTLPMLEYLNSPLNDWRFPSRERRKPAPPISLEPLLITMRFHANDLVRHPERFDYTMRMMLFEAQRFFHQKFKPELEDRHLIQKDFKQFNPPTSKMNNISINGTKYQGNNIVVSNGKVIIDGKDFTPDTKQINISVEGNIEELNVDTCDKVTVTGNVKHIFTTSGDVDVNGNVAMGIQTVSGDVDCGDVSGSISTVSGSVKHRRPN